MLGVPDETASVSTFDMLPLLSRIQLFDGFLSPKISEPTVRKLLKWTVLSAVISKVLKSAIASAPLATMPPDQLAVLDQRPPEVVLIQVPLVAEARGKPSEKRAA